MKLFYLTKKRKKKLGLFSLYGVQGEGINFSPLEKSAVYPLIYAMSAKKSGANEDEARYGKN